MGQPWGRTRVWGPKARRAEGEGEEEAGTPPTFRAGFLEPARKYWDLIWGLDLETMVCIETADRGPQCVIALTFPAFQELPWLVSQV